MAPGLAEDAPSLTAAAIAVATGGTLEGDAGATVYTVASLDRAGPGQLTFCSGEDYREALATTAASVVLVVPAMAAAPCPAAARIVLPEPMSALLALLPRLYRPAPRAVGVHPTVVIGRGVQLGAEVAIAPYVVIGAGAEIGDRAWIGAGVVIGEGVRIGSDVRLHPGVTLYPGTVLGDRVQLHAGVRLGSDGFGYAYRDGAHQKIPHVGRCLIGNDVEIGANTTIDRGSIDDTVIGAGTKIDNLVHVAHNVRIGRLCLIMAQVGIAGSVRVEDGAILAGQVGVSGHHTIGRGARLAAQAGVFGDIPAGETWSGYPARPHREALKAQAAMFRLPSIIRALERLLARDAAKGD